MMRLVTQFDDGRMRATVATPTCCCCCCCCLASLLSTTAVAVLNVDELAGSTQMPAPSRWLYRIAALAVLPAELYELFWANSSLSDATVAAFRAAMEEYSGSDAPAAALRYPGADLPLALPSDRQFRQLRVAAACAPSPTGRWTPGASAACSRPSRRFALVEVGAAVQSLALRLVAEGLAGYALGGLVDDRVTRLLGLQGTSEQIALGYACGIAA